MVTRGNLLRLPQKFDDGIEMSIFFCGAYAWTSGSWNVQHCHWNFRLNDVFAFMSHKLTRSNTYFHDVIKSSMAVTHITVFQPNNNSKLLVWIGISIPYSFGKVLHFWQKEHLGVMNDFVYNNDTPITFCCWCGYARLDMNRIAFPLTDRHVFEGVWMLPLRYCWPAKPILPPYSPWFCPCLFPNDCAVVVQPS